MWTGDCNTGSCGCIFKLLSRCLHVSDWVWSVAFAYASGISLSISGWWTFSYATTHSNCIRSSPNITETLLKSMSHGFGPLRNIIAAWIISQWHRRANEVQQNAVQKCCGHDTSQGLGLPHEYLSPNRMFHLCHNYTLTRREKSADGCASWRGVLSTIV